jgi:pimeloyl-ACP methyl ester carboxylesterase
LSDKPRDARYSLYEQADLAEAVAADCGVTSCVLVTHDMGQTVGAELTKRLQEGKLGFEVTRTIVTNGSTFVDMAQLSPGQQFLLALPDEPLTESLDLEGFKPGLRDTFSTEHQPSEEELDAMLALLRHNDGDRLLPRLIRYVEERRANFERWTDALVSFPGPLTVLWGEQDPIAVVGMAHRIAEMNPAAEVITWPDVGHWPSIEVPDRVAASILERL